MISSTRLEDLFWVWPFSHIGSPIDPGDGVIIDFTNLIDHRIYNLNSSYPKDVSNLQC